MIWILYLILALPPAVAKDYNLVADRFELGSWNEKSLTVSRGVQGIKKLDDWFSNLGGEDRAKYRSEYSINRNRLYLVTQQKLLSQEIINLSSFTTNTRSYLNLGYTKEGLTKLQQELEDRKKYFSEKWEKSKSDKGYLEDQIYVNYTNFESGRSNPLSQTYSKSAYSMRDMSQVRRSMNQLDIETLRELLKKLQTTIARPSCDENLETSSSTKKEKLLAELGIKKWRPSSTSRDLSAYYGAPKTQWREEYPGVKCVGYAIAGDLEVELNRNKLTSLSNSTVSGDLTYAVAKEAQGQGQRKGKDYCDPSTYDDDSDGLLFPETFEALKHRPICVGKQKYNITEFKFIELENGEKQPFDYNFFRALIDNKMPPVISINSDSRTESADWISITNAGKYRHALNVVGYGEDIHPETLCKVHYFIVRDSLGKKLIHYKIRADNLLEHLDGVYKVTGVKEFSGTLPNASKSDAPATQ